MLCLVRGTNLKLTLSGSQFSSLKVKGTYALGFPQGASSFPAIECCKWAPFRLECQQWPGQQVQWDLRACLVRSSTWLWALSFLSLFATLMQGLLLHSLCCIKGLFKLSSLCRPTLSKASLTSIFARFPSAQGFAFLSSCARIACRNPY